MNRVIHFEIHSSDPERTAKFYRDIFGWEIKEWVMPGLQIKNENRYWTVMTAPEKSKEPGINGGIVFRKGPAPVKNQPVSAYICTVGVVSVDEHIEKITKAGGTVALPKMPIPTMGWLAYLKDLDGNIFGIMQEDKNAK